MMNATTQQAETPLPIEIATLFRKAAACIEAGIALLDLSEYKCCDRCNVRHFTNFADAKTHEQFEKYLKPLRDAANRFDKQ